MDTMVFISRSVVKRRQTQQRMSTGRKGLKRDASKNKNRSLRIRLRSVWTSADILVLHHSYGNNVDTQLYFAVWHHAPVRRSTPRTVATARSIKLTLQNEWKRGVGTVLFDGENNNSFQWKVQNTS